MGSTVSGWLSWLTFSVSYGQNTVQPFWSVTKKPEDSGYRNAAVKAATCVISCAIRKIKIRQEATSSLYSGLQKYSGVSLI